MEPWFGDDALRWALLVLCPGYLWGGWHLWRARRTVAADLEGVEPPMTDAAEAITGGQRCREI
jgi:hypothetical protein